MSKVLPASRLPALIRRKIKQSDLSVYALAKEVGISQPALWQIQRGGSMKIETLVRLMKYFDIGVCDHAEHTHWDRPQR